MMQILYDGPNHIRFETDHHGMSIINHQGNYNNGGPGISTVNDKTMVFHDRPHLPTWWIAIT